ncbi:MAG: nitroreductase family protein [Oscillospiraceae bacterium]|jgi:nitroreductase|nr:nitroreductase family protein [Oscillospiraceae bacterium]
MQTTVQSSFHTPAQETSSFLDLCARRQSCRSFSDQPIDHNTLVAVAEAARLAPSACNSQPWSFVLVESPEKVAEAARCGQAMGINGFLNDAKAILLILEQPARLMPQIGGLLDSQYFAAGDIGGAALAACLAAEDHGVGSCIIGLFDRPKLRELLDLPDWQPIAYYIALGYPKNPVVRPKARKALAELVKFV